MNSFQEFELAPSILRGVDTAGFAKPFPIQEQAIGPLLAGLDVIGQARTGTGKTAAFGLPLLQSINTQNNHVQALVLSPTRELALQITTELRKLGKFTGTKILTIYGGQPITFQLEALNRGVHVIVGTPGRVIDHIKRGTLQLDSVRFVVLDEADTMLDMGFIEDIEFVLDLIPRRRQLSLFSAMMPQRIIELSGKYMHNPERILINSDEPSVDTLEQYYTVVGRDDKLSVLMDLLTREKPSSAMIFCRTKYGAHRLAINLQQRFLSAVPLHGDLSQRQRDHSMNLFRTGRADILVATDVASRGIDVQQVDCVINYDAPNDPLLYFHRVGRTARAGGSGKAYSLVSQGELGVFARICSLTKVKIKPLRPEDEGHAGHVGHNGYNERLTNRTFGSRRPFGPSGGRRKKWHR